MSTIYGNIHSLESFGAADGPGVRFIVFLQGCPMRCMYCHNPDTWHTETNLHMTPQEVLDKALRYRSYWGEKGGITVSGGEALSQIDFLIAFFTLAHKQHIHTCLDTSGSLFTNKSPFFQQFQALMDVTDLFILDLKHINNDMHKKLTGHSNAPILAMARALSDAGKPMWIRHVLVPTYTDTDEWLHELRAFIDTLHTVERVEVLPYHTLGVFKWEEKNLAYPLEGIEPPTPERLANAKRILGAVQT